VFGPSLLKSKALALSSRENMVRNTSEAQIIAERKKHLKALRRLGIDPYPSASRRTVSLSEAQEHFGALKKRKNLILVGRLMAKREHGGLIFGDLKDEKASIQVMFRENLLGQDFDILALTDVGDFLEVQGRLVLTKRGEKTLEAKNFRLLSKTLRSLPSRWYGLKEIETRFRKRYLDILLNREVRERFITRHKVIQLLREFLVRDGFLEFDTPVLQPIAGGALATPFKTYYEAEDLEVFLRIAPELYLKRLVIAGFEKVFEFARVFRNEGVSKEHLQDFTMLEFYQAYADYRDLMKLTERLVTGVVKALYPNLKVPVGGRVINFKTPWRVISLRNAIKQYSGIDIDEARDEKALTRAIRSRKLKLTFRGKASWGKLVDELYKETVRPHLLGPVFLVDYPLALSPLAKRKEGEPNKVERFQLVIGGWEIVNAFSELNDPLEQKERFEEQLKRKREGDREAHPYDQEFIEALEYGMPPTAGFGMGIERLLALLTGAENVRETVAFPFVKPKRKR